MTSTDPSSASGGEGPTHPPCPICGIPMWLVEVQHLGQAERFHFECKVCDAKAVIPPLV
jgi:hypothetical protein